ncbi:hypothetical protein NXS19_008266 [Fusarium pseudograminearum]|nr:hypothetical protein NXS19_008266 [Fusarium pseudograminearum]
MRWAIGSTFMQLLEGNVDHFAAEAQATYDAGHAVALELAAEGNLEIALDFNGFADHFLEDSFAAGHIRVPRREIAEIAKTNPISIPSFSKIMNASSNEVDPNNDILAPFELTVFSRSCTPPEGPGWQAFQEGGEWVEFWTETFAQVEDQVKLMISKVWGRAFG